MRNRRWRASLSVSSLFALALATQAAAHPAVELRDINGVPISQTLDGSKSLQIGGTTYYAGNPVSWEGTCGKCHKSITGDVGNGVKSPGPIHGTYHIGRGWDEMSDDFGAKRVEEKEDWRKFLRSLGDDGAW